MVESPGLAPTFPARIFCLARSGDWNAAALTLRTGQALGYITEAEEALLSRFLDPDLYEGEPPLPTPAPVTPLAWRMFEAIGEPLSTATLPMAFAHAELRPQAGWKSAGRGGRTVGAGRGDFVKRAAGAVYRTAGGGVGWGVGPGEGVPDGLMRRCRPGTARPSRRSCPRYGRR